MGYPRDSYWIVTVQSVRRRTLARAWIPTLIFAVAVTGGVGAYAILSGAIGIDRESRPGLIEASAVESIVAPNQPNLPAPVIVRRELRGIDAVRASEIGLENASALIGAALMEFDFDADHVAPHEDLFRSFVAVYATVADAQVAFSTAVTHLQSPLGWGSSSGPLSPHEPDPRLGDQGVHLVQGHDLGYPELSVFLWRVDNAVLMAADFHPYDWPGLIGLISRDAERRARGQ